MEEHIEENRKETVETPIDVEMTPEEKVIEEELSQNQEKWAGQLGREVEEWKANLSKYSKAPHDTMARDIGNLQRDGFSLEQIHLYHAYDQLTKGSSLYYKTKFDNLATDIEARSHENAEDEAFSLLRILRELLDRSTQEEEAKKAA